MVKDRERVVVTGVLTVLVLGWLGFFVHRSPRFPGSGPGAIFGIAGAALMLVPLAYVVAKRAPVFRARVASQISLPSLLALHTYTGIMGALLALIHTAHKFDSWLGMVLTALMLLVVASGYAVRYLLTYVSREIADKLVLLQTARGDLDHAWGVLERSADAVSLSGTPIVAAGLTGLRIDAPFAGEAAAVIRTAEGVADLEYAIKTHELFKRWFARSLKLHIVLSVVFYVLLAVHIGAGFYFGLRWLR